MSKKHILTRNQKTAEKLKEKGEKKSNLVHRAKDAETDSTYWEHEHDVTRETFQCDMLHIIQPHSSTLHTIIPPHPDMQITRKRISIQHLLCHSRAGWLTEIPAEIQKKTDVCSFKVTVITANI